MKHLNSIPDQPIAALESLVTAIGLEGFSLTDLNSSGGAFLGKLIDSSSQSLEHTFQTLQRNVGAKISLFRQSSDDTKYNNIMRLRVPVPEGFSGNVASYIEVLEDGVEQALRIFSEILLPLEGFLAQVVSTPSFAKDSRYHLRFLQRASDDRLNNTKKLKHFFGGSSKADGIFGDLYKNMNEWTTSYKKIQQLQGKAESIDREELLKKVADISKLVSLLKNAFEAGELQGISKPIVTEIANGVYEAAKQLEHLSVTLFNVYTLANTMSETADKI